MDVKRVVEEVCVKDIIGRGEARGIGSVVGRTGN
jgi:hypothetical protein